MEPTKQKDLDQLKASLPKVEEEITAAAAEERLSEEVERAKGLVAGFIAKYDDLMKQLSPNDQKELVRTIGLKVEEIEEKLTELRQAPE